tara:strand:- start:831 stop:1259 length:429 start_codon:yes stop_codon:yes gene_type:complete
MDKLNKNSELGVTLIKHHIKDLSFENPQSILDNNAENNNNNNISESVNFIYKPFDKDFFSIIFKYSCECSSKTNAKKLFLLELDYFGFFKIMNNKSDNQAELTKRGAQLIFPFVKSIVEDLSVKGGSLPITLRNLDFDLIKA